MPAAELTQVVRRMFVARSSVISDLEGASGAVA